MVGTADAEVENPSVENPELEGSPSKGWGRSEYSHVCFTYCKDFFLAPISSFPFHAPAFFQNLSQVFPLLIVANTVPVWARRIK